MPSKFRAALSGKVVLVKGVDKCISLYPEETYAQLTSAALEGLNPFSPQVRELKRMFYGNALDTELDSAGRVMLPPRYLEHAGMDGRDVVVTGAGDCLELWDANQWQAYDADLAQRALDLTASLGNPS